MAKRSPVKIIIKTFGGVRPAARALGVHPKTLYQWEKYEAIPARRIRPIIKAAAAIGEDLTVEELLV